MNVVYPIIITKDSQDKVPYFVQIPDLNGFTQGTSIANAMEMARDYIGLTILDREDNHESIPESNTALPHIDEGTATLIDVNIDTYRRKHDQKAIKKTLTIPNYLNELGKEQNINFSQVLTDGLKSILEN
ncbi:type II toxin-antitoxin system HicB family antitoxin [Lactobacillus sp. DCY120]|uniref:Type II toxin-antitoxin system HicB family antitoxin n=1 Tax=Bombilactobacillus apium TaxID=2675299 RepID=A0A850R894_9LACO|nr:type II toxin-antitoxin system HicB family antitoxin [Bombilactobacillus apium]NVY96932.1 type II toxin-antitoxin system HicB family antitoxin [Bombilactobacillus apium]